MRAYLDTGFIDWSDPAAKLFSLALVVEDGRKLCERDDFDRDACSLLLSYKRSTQHV